MRDVAYVALGSNLGDREKFLAFARREISALPHTTLVSATEPEETAPIGPGNQGAYLNQMIAVETDLDPHVLLDLLHEIERRAGRVRRERWAARTLDLDIVKFERQTVDDGSLVIPHPALRDRDFWQRELSVLEGERS